ncbi:MAG: type II toxin-antitoxin system RelE/ParE family toxin [Kiritimatiellia bacterium]|nr:type II toxin-antitoxin system RelE/ParE family toxin [Kiritimatiellia bacterium]
MVVYFHTSKLQKQCSSKGEAIRKFGPERAKKLMQRLQELEAAENLADIARVPPPRCHELKEDRKGQLSVDLQHPYRLLFIPANDPVPQTAEGGLDWEKVTKIEIVEIEDTH